MFFVEYGTYTPNKQAGRIEIYPINEEGKIIGDIEKDKEEIGIISLPIEMWRAMRKKLDSMDF